MNQVKAALEKINFGHRTTVFIREYTKGTGKLWIRHSETKKPLVDAPTINLTTEYKKSELERLMAEIAIFRNQWEEDFFGGKFLVKDNKPVIPATLRDLIDKWNDGFSVRQTISNNKSYMTKVTKVLGKTIEVKAINRSHVEKVLAELKKQGLHQNSQRYVMKKFRTFMLWCVEEQHIDKAPSFKKLVPAEIIEKREFFTPEQLAKIQAVEFKHPNVQDCFLFACFTGCRIGEARKLTWKEIDLSEGTYKRWQQKVEKFVDVPLNEEAVAILSRQKKVNERVFQVPVDQVFNRHYKNLLKAAEVESNAKPRNGRSTFARIAIQNEVEPSIAMEMLGQSSLRTIMTYYNEYDLKDKRAALAKMSNGFKAKA